MKKLIFTALAVLALTACDPTGKTEGKCTDISELQKAIQIGSTDTARYDLNGDGEINIADINFLLNQTKSETDTTAVDTI